MKYITVIVGLLALVTTVKAQQIDQENSEVKFKIDNLYISSVKGTIQGLSGDVVFNPSDLENSSFNVCISPATVNTGNRKRDEHLRSEDFFNVEKYPDICFESTSITSTSSGYLAKGKLTIRAVTKSIDIVFNYANDQFEGTLKVNRLDFNVGNDYGSFTAGEEVEVSIHCTLTD